MSSKHCIITLENYNGIYYCPGQTINGYLTCNFEDSISIRGIYLIFSGKARVEWSESDSDNNSTTYYADESFIDTKMYCLQPKSGKQMSVDKGTHKFPFQFTLPSRLPSSLEHEKYYIRYEITAIVERIFKFDYKARIRYNVLSFVELNHLTDIPVVLSSNKDTHTFFVKTGSVNMTVRLPKAGYALNEQIHVNFDINADNQSVAYVKLKLVKEMQYFSKHPYKKMQSQSIVIARTELDGFKNQKSNSYDMCLTVPKEFNVGNLDPCTIIKFVPHILIEAELPFHRNLKMSVPLIIGQVKVS